MPTKTTSAPSAQPLRHHINVLGQLLKYIPRGIVDSAAREFGVDVKARAYSVWSHLAAMIFVQVAHAFSLNDVCDWLRLKRRAVASFGVTPPARNTLSHANKGRSADFVQAVFWRTLAHLHHCEPAFGGKRKGRGLLRRFKVKVHAVDSTTMELVANCMDWAQHRRRKAAAKMHLRLDTGSFLPACAIVDTAGEHDNKRAREVCAGLYSGEVVLFDKAYVDWDHLRDLDARGVFWVTRAKDNFQYTVVRRLPRPANGRILKDEIVRLKGPKGRTKAFKGWTLRRVEAWVEVDGKDRVMVFITNNTVWSAGSVCDLYKARWEIEVFFKQVKQTLRLSGFLGYSANAIRWQVWTALLVYVLLRFAAHLSQWGHSFTRLFAVLRAALWERLDALALLRSYGTAGGSFRLLGAAQTPDSRPPRHDSHGTAQRQHFNNTTGNISEFPTRPPPHSPLSHGEIRGYSTCCGMLVSARLQRTSSYHGPWVARNADGLKKQIPSNKLVNPIPIEALMQHADSLYRFAISRVKNHHAAEDLVQESLSIAWQRIDTFDARSSLGTWLIGIMKFNVIDHFRRSKRTPTDQNIEPGNDDTNPVDCLFDCHGSWKVDPNHGLELLAKAPDQLASNHEALECISTCLAKLPERLRILFNLREVDGLDVTSASSAAGVTPGSAAVLLTRSRQKLRACLQENGIQPCNPNGSRHPSPTGSFRRHDVADSEVARNLLSGVPNK